MKFQRSQSPSVFLLLMLLKLQEKRDRQGGYTLVITIAVLLILSVLLLTFAITSKVDNASSSASAKGNTGFYAAEAGLNVRAKAVRERFEGYNRPSGTSPAHWKDCLSSSGFSNKGTGDFQCQTDNNIAPQPVTTYVEDETGATPENIVIPTGEVNEGLTAQEYRYNVVSIAQDNQGKPSAIVGLTFKSRLIPLFQFAAFYNQDMDISLPPGMTLSGPVHSNNDLYLNAAVGNTLAIKGQVTTANRLYRGRKDVNQCSGTVQIDDPTPKALNLGAANCGGGRIEYTQPMVAPWQGRIRTGIPQLNPPPPSDFDANPGRLYWDSADLRLVLDVNNPSAPVLQVRSAADTDVPLKTAMLTSTTCAPTQTKVTTSTATSVTVTPGTASLFAANDLITLGNDPHLYVVDNVTFDVITVKGTGFKSGPPPVNTDVRKPVISFSDKTFKNYREKRGLNGTGRMDHTPIQMMNVDVRGVLGCAEALMDRSLDDDTEGGLVWFVTVKGPNANTINDYGIRLYNGQDLVTPIGGKTIRGLSIVSDQAIYIRGNYNCGTACTNSTFAAAANLSQRKPAAIMADSINLLSNAWPFDDSWSNNLISTHFIPTDVRGRPATETTYNAAFLSGIDITGGVNRGGQDLNDATGGGLNNYPRLHEDWRTRLNTETQYLNYLGSLVSFNAPRKVNGKFCGSGTTGDCNIYNPPIRDWRYDTQFNNAANLPPLTPRVVSLKQELFSRNFDQATLPLPSFWEFLAPQRVFGVLGSLVQANS